MTQSDVAQAPLSSEEKQKTPRERIRWAAAGTALFLAGFVGETVLDEVKKFFMPDLVEKKVIELQADIESKTGAIMKLSQSIESQLSEIGADSTLGQETTQLIAAIESLRPDIYKAADLSSEHLQRLVSAKDRELSMRGVSTSPDFELLPGRGATVCGFGNSFGFMLTSGKGVIDARLSGSAKSSNHKTLYPGEDIRVSVEEGASISVNYVGFNDTTGLYAFDVSCPR